jgi:hypothetical protein
MITEHLTQTQRLMLHYRNAYGAYTPIEIMQQLHISPLSFGRIRCEMARGGYEWKTTQRRESLPVKVYAYQPTLDSIANYFYSPETKEATHEQVCA